MRLDFVNPVTLIPGQTTEAGAPIGTQQNLVPFENVVPTFNVPDDGAKPEDKQEEEGPEKHRFDVDEAPLSEEGSNPELFVLVTPENFRDLFRLYLGSDERQLLQIVKKMRLFNKIDDTESYSGFFIDNINDEDIREASYSKTTFYHYNFPGKRFKGLL